MSTSSCFGLFAAIFTYNLAKYTEKRLLVEKGSRPLTLSISSTIALLQAITNLSVPFCAQFFTPVVQFLLVCRMLFYEVASDLDIISASKKWLGGWARILETYLSWTFEMFPDLRVVFCPAFYRWTIHLERLFRNICLFYLGFPCKNPLGSVVWQEASTLELRFEFCPMVTNLCKILQLPLAGKWNWLALTVEFHGKFFWAKVR